MIPFTSFDEIKPLLSGFDASFDFQNVRSSFITASDFITNVIGQPVYDLAMNHYESDNYNQDDETDPGYIRLNNLVFHIQNALANRGMFEHYEFLLVRVSNHSITTVNNENERTVSRQLSNDIKEKLINTYYFWMNKLLLFLNLSATRWRAWEAGLTVAADAVLKYNSTYYKALAGHTTGETFDANLYSEFADMVLPEWTNADQFLLNQHLIINNYHEFNQIYNIDNSVYFFQLVGYIIRRVIDDDIQSRLSDFEEIKHQLESNTLTANNARIIAKIKKYLVYKSVYFAALEFDYEELPRPIRRNINNEFYAFDMKQKEKDRSVSKFAGNLLIQANKYLAELDELIDTIDRVNNTVTYETILTASPVQTSSDKFAFLP